MTTAYVQIKDIIKQVDLYDVNQNIIAFSEEGGPVKEDFFMRASQTKDGKPLYILKDVGFNPGDIVKSIYSKAKIKELAEDDESPLQALATFTLGRTGRSIPTNLEVLTFEINTNKIVLPIENLENGDIVQVECYSFKVPTTGKNLVMPSQFLIEAPEREVQKYRLITLIADIMRTKDSKSAAKRDEIMALYRRITDQLHDVMGQMRAINSKDNVQFCIEELNGINRSSEQLMQDERVLSVKPIADGKGISIETTALWCEIQNQGATTPVVFIGPQIIEINERYGRPKIRNNWKSPLGRYPHQSGEEMCIGNYSTAYSQALQKKDYLACFEIAIEVKTHVNLESTYGTSEWLQNIPGATSALSARKYADLKNIMDEWNEKTSPQFNTLTKKKVTIPKSFSDDLVKEIVEEFYPSKS